MLGKRNVKFFHSQTCQAVRPLAMHVTSSGALDPVLKVLIQQV